MSRTHVHPESMSLVRAALCSLALAATATAGLFVSPAARAADVGVSISVSQPGVYGRIDIGRFPTPELMVAQPMWIQKPRVVVAQPQPVYLWVPPGHQKNWSKHCSRYSACGVPVYFVKEDWYQQRYSHPQQHNYDQGDDRGKGKDKGDKGHGKGHGHGKGKDRD